MDRKQKTYILRQARHILEPDLQEYKQVACGREESTERETSSGWRVQEAGGKSSKGQGCLVKRHS